MCAGHVWDGKEACTPIWYFSELIWTPASSHYRIALQEHGEVTARREVPAFCSPFLSCFHEVNSSLSALMGTARAFQPKQLDPAPTWLYAKGSDFLLTHALADLLEWSKRFGSSRFSSSPGGSPNKQRNDPNPAGSGRVKSKRPRNFTKWIISPWMMRRWKTRLRVDEPCFPTSKQWRRNSKQGCSKMWILPCHELHSPGDRQGMGKASVFTLEICKHNLKIHPIQEGACL